MPMCLKDENLHGYLGWLWSENWPLSGGLTVSGSFIVVGWVLMKVLCCFEVSKKYVGYDLENLIWSGDFPNLRETCLFLIAQSVPKQSEISKEALTVSETAKWHLKLYKLRSSTYKIWFWNSSGKCFIFEIKTLVKLDFSRFCNGWVWCN